MAYKTIKRTFDLFCCCVGFPIFLIIFVIAATAIKLEDGGPAFYKAERIGRGCRKIYMYKFRSMKVGAENILNPDGGTYNAKDDPRVTRIGRLLRETSIDETPQILNVFKGEMSAVGPRASAWEALSSYREDEISKMNVRPGITGYTQAYYRNSLTVREKRLKDAWYAENASLWMDVKILFKTVHTLITRENIYSNQEKDQGGTV